MFNGHRISHWLLSCVLAWLLWGAVFGTAAHIFLGIALIPLIVFFVAQCVLQAAVIPWFFAARKTAARPQGDSYKRTLAVIVWLTLASELFNCVLFGGDFSDHTAVLIFLGLPVFTGAVALAFARSRRDRFRTATR